MLFITYLLYTLFSEKAKAAEETRLNSQLTDAQTNIDNLTTDNSDQKSAIAELTQDVENLRKELAEKQNNKASDKQGKVFITT